MLIQYLVKQHFIKKSAILLALSGILLSGCSNDQNYKREADGNFDYLESPSLVPLIIPSNVNLPSSSRTYIVYPNNSKGGLAKNVDIRSPILPLAIINDSSATYRKQEVIFEGPMNNGFWQSIPQTLAVNNIIIESSTGNTLKTTKAYLIQGSESSPVEASFLIRLHHENNREYVIVKANTLTQSGEDITSDEPTVQRYVVGFFNLLMDSVAEKEATNYVTDPATSDPSKAKTNDNK